MKKLFVVLILTLSLPVAASMVGPRHQAQAFNSVAVAGHTQFGGACDCSEPGCICEPGEGGGNRNAANPSDGGAGLLLALLMLGFVLRVMRR
jgi:hypothetical protein